MSYFRKPLLIGGLTIVSAHFFWAGIFGWWNLPGWISLVSVIGYAWMTYYFHDFWKEPIHRIVVLFKLMSRNANGKGIVHVMDPHNLALLDTLAKQNRYIRLSYALSKRRK